MRKSEKLSNQFMHIINLLDLVDNQLQKMDVEFVDQSRAYEFHNKIQNIIEEFEEFHYETCAPLQADEDDRDAEIERLEKRISQLKSMQ